MAPGSLALVLHAHLPYVRHPEHEDFLEEDWLFEAITETYLPLLLAFDRLREDQLPFALTLTLSPTLVSMLGDELLLSRYQRRLGRLLELAEKEVLRTVSREGEHRLAAFYRGHLLELQEAFERRYQRDLVGAFKRLQDEGHLEIITCCATHGFLPLMQAHPEAVRAQIEVAVQHHRTTFGRAPSGIWLAECGYYPGVEVFLAEAGIRFFFLDTHGLVDAVPRPICSVYAPIFTEAGVAAYGRDPESAEQVWSASSGYPGNAVYRDFYRDIGWDLDLDYVRPYIQPTGGRKNTGIKYHRITGKTDQKELYEPAVARAQAQADARDFVAHRVVQLQRLSGQMPGRPPVIVAPYDAELFGHWWFEGPWFLEAVFRACAERSGELTVTTPVADLQLHPENQVCRPPMCSWGERGYAQMWLDGSNDWIYRHLDTCAAKMTALAQRHVDPTSLERRALNQAARELLLAQASDWAFIMKSGTVVDYAVRRTREHVLRFLRLDRELADGAVDAAWLAELEAHDALFPELDYRIYRPR